MSWKIIIVSEDKIFGRVEEGAEFVDNFSLSFLILREKD